jgi:hypothetical protein
MTYRRGASHHRYHDIPTEVIRREYEAGRSADYLGRQYGVSAVTICRKLKAAGVIVRRPGYTETLQCSDGHVVQSSYELVIDEWLTAHGLTHEVHPFCPWYTGGSAAPRADFRVGDTFIEVWGLIGNTAYEARRQEKIAKYHEVRARLIQIFPHHIHDEDYSPLERLL